MGHRLEMLLVPFEHLEHFSTKLGIETQTCEFLFFVLDRSLNEVFVVEIIESAILLFSDVSQTMECLDVSNDKVKFSS